jgi:hypothetical protein
MSSGVRAARGARVTDADAVPALRLPADTYDRLPFAVWDGQNVLPV